MNQRECFSCVFMGTTIESSNCWIPSSIEWWTFRSNLNNLKLWKRRWVDILTLILQTNKKNLFQVKRSLQNFRREAPYQMAIFGVTYLTAEYQWNKDELLSCIDGEFNEVTNDPLIKKDFAFSRYHDTRSRGIHSSDANSSLHWFVDVRQSNQRGKMNQPTLLRSDRWSML